MMDFGRDVFSRFTRLLLIRYVRRDHQMGSVNPTTSKPRRLRAKSKSKDFSLASTAVQRSQLHRNPLGIDIFVA